MMSFTAIALEILEHIPPKPESAHFLLVLSPKGTRKKIKKKKKTLKVSRRNPKDQSRNKLKTKQ